MTSKHIMNCPSCFKTFKRTGCYEKHIFICQRRDEEIIPNNKQLWDMITSLTEKYNNVQSELESLKRKISIQNKKIDILEWLNRNSKNNSNNNWDDVMSNFEIKIIDLEIIFEKGLINGTSIIIINYLNSLNNQDIIRCYEQKTNTLYVYNNTWMILSISNFEIIYNNIKQTIFKTFEEYKNINEIKLQNDDSFQNKFNDNFMKLLCTDISFQTQSMRIKNKIFVHFKQSFNSVELQIE